MWHIRFSLSWLACAVLTLAVGLPLHAADPEGAISGYGAFKFNKALTQEDIATNGLNRRMSAEEEMTSAAGLESPMSYYTIGDMKLLAWESSWLQPAQLQLPSGLLSGTMTAFTDLQGSIKGVELSLMITGKNPTDLAGYDQVMKDLQQLLLNKYDKSLVKQNEFYYGIDLDRPREKNMTGQLHLQDQQGNDLLVDYQTITDVPANGFWKSGPRDVTLRYLEAGLYKALQAELHGKEIKAAEAL